MLEERFMKRIAKERDDEGTNITASSDLGSSYTMLAKKHEEFMLSGPLLWKI